MHKEVSGKLLAFTRLLKPAQPKFSRLVRPAIHENLHLVKILKVNYLRSYLSILGNRRYEHNKVYVTKSYIKEEIFNHKAFEI